MTNYRRTEATTALIRAGYPVSAGATWKQIESGTDWLNAGAVVLIPGSSGNVSLSELAAGASGTWHWRTWTRSQAVQRVWVLQLVARPAEFGVSCDIVAGSAASYTVPVSDGYALASIVTYTEPLAAQSAALTDLTLTLTAHGGHVKLLSVTCYEQTRATLAASANDHGIDPTSMFPGARIYAGNYPTIIGSVTGAAKALAAADARRVGLFQWSVPTTNPAQRNGAYQVITGLAQPALARKLLSGATTSAKVFWSAYAKVAAASGDVQLTTSHSGITDVHHITTTSYAWSTPTQIAIDCEDITVIDGRQGSAWDEIAVSIRGNSTTISVAAVSVFEEP